MDQYIVIYKKNTPYQSQANGIVESTNKTLQQLGLKHTRERQFDVPPTEKFEEYFGKYSVTTKAYRTHTDPYAFFWDMGKFLLDVACVHPKTYGMLKSKVGIIIVTYTGHAVD